MNQKIIIGAGIGAVILLAVGAYLYRSPVSPQENAPVSGQTFQTEPSERSFVVSMTDEGFSPAEFTISKGMTVAWVNNSTKFRWPASNIHPTHEEYPAFDPLEPIAPGEVWEFAFDEAGSWRFHDHLIPRFIGLVTVTE